MAGLGSSTTYGGGQTRTDAWGDIKPYVPYNAGSAFNALVAAPPARRYNESTANLTGQAGNGDEQRAQSLATRAQILQLQAAAGPAPTKTISGSNIIPGQVLDPEVMNAYQRQLFLPQSAQFENPAAEAAASRSRRQDDYAADAAFNALVQRRRMQEATGGIG